MANPMNCLICSRAVIKDNNEETRKRSQFQLGLQLFCKLQKINVNYVSQLISCGGREHGGDARDAGPPPCCKECCLAFEQMVRLQQAIELMQTNLIEQLDKIKAALRTSVPSDFEEEDPLKIPPDDILGKIRDQLLSCVRNSSTPSSSTSVTQPNRKRRQPVSKSSQHPSSKKAKEHLACSVILERLPLNHLNIIPKIEPPSISAPTVDNSDLDDEEYLPSPEEASSPPFQDNHDENEDEDDYPWESEAKPIPEQLSTEIIANSEKMRKSKFSLISPDTLLYQNTLIKVSQGYTRFTCQEPECHSPSFSDASLNWNNLFNQIADHIESTHNNSRHDDLLIACPLCPESFPRSHKLRTHLITYPKRGRKLEGHGIQTVICEVCWKPIRNLADAYRCHQWLHKNDQEKEESPEGLPPTLLSKVNRRLRKLGKLTIKKVKPKVIPRPKSKRKISNLKHKKILPPSPKPPSPFQDNHEDDDHGEDGDDFPLESESKPIPEHLPNRTTIDEPTISSSDPTDNGGRRIRKSKLKALEFIRNNSTSQNPEISAELDPDNSSDFNEDEYVPPQDNHDDDNDEEDEYPWESEAKQIPEKFNQISSNRETIKHTKFSLISPDILLYQYTLIKVSQGYTHFTCQEPECPSPHFSDSSLNWNNLFKQMADHINDFHGTPPPQIEHVKCPLCPASKLPGPQFRAHLVSYSRTGRKHKGHGIQTVICDICWKPIRNMADAYRSHQWVHKNEHEKDQATLPSSILSKLIKSKGKRKKHVKKLLKFSKLAKKRMPIKSNFKSTSLNTPTPTTGKTPKVCDHFSRIQENSSETLLLYKYTLLKASYGISLSCQEPNCDHITNGTDFAAFEHFKNHVKTCHPQQSTQNSDTTWKCPLCCQELTTCFGFRRHLLFNCSTASYTTNNSFPFICTVCWRPMSNVTQLEYHQWLHKSESEKDSEGQPRPKLVQFTEKERKSGFKCRHCPKVLCSSDGLQAHEATHLPKEHRKKYMCHQCPKLFLSPVAVRGHVEREHQRELMRMRTCPICSKQFNWRYGHYFQMHLKSHRNERDFVCDVCGKAFLAGKYLKKHREKVHEGKVRERRWQCEFCEMNYQTNDHLKRHKRSAHKDKVREEEDEGKGKEVPVFIGPRIAFPCPVCERAFPLRSRMKKHWEKSCKNKKF